MTISKAYEGTYQGKKAVWFQFGRYEAAILPEIGGNLITFRDNENKYNFLHEPTLDEMESFKARLFIHGIPVSFPPNRFEDGKFLWNGRTYQFPVNEPSTGNHLHGFVHSEKWEVADFGSSASESFVTVSLTVDKQHAVYEFCRIPSQSNCVTRSARMACLSISSLQRWSRCYAMSVRFSYCSQCTIRPRELGEGLSREADHWRALGA